jgi:hypothetical protein
MKPLHILNSLNFATSVKGLCNKCMQTASVADEVLQAGYHLLALHCLVVNYVALPRCTSAVLRYACLGGSLLHAMLNMFQSCILPG